MEGMNPWGLINREEKPSKQQSTYCNHYDPFYLDSPEKLKLTIERIKTLIIKEKIANYLIDRINKINRNCDICPFRDRKYDECSLLDRNMNREIKYTCKHFLKTGEVVRYSEIIQSEADGGFIKDVEVEV